ncbi:MAG: FKBP-type peptidyl-prolyl cis-trans isomerase [Flammeovirgaceae bacterium]
MRLKYTFIGVLFLGLFACENKVVTTKTGCTYEIVEESGGAAIQDGSFLQVVTSLRVFTDEELVQKIDGHKPAVSKLVFSEVEKHPVFSILKELSVGDSVKITMPYNEEHKNFMPDNAKETTRVEYYVRVVSAEGEEEYNTRMQKERQEQIDKEDGEIQKYLSDNGLEAEKTESGLYYIITEEKGGESPEPGDKVSVHYTGTLLDGSKFDSSVDRGTPFEFPLGQRRVIAGWDIGIDLLGKGDKATLLIPSRLGYGPSSPSPKIPANSILKFDVELVDFEKAPEKNTLK